MNIHPDIQFIEEVKIISKSQLKTCMQCGECSVVCSLATDNKPFPRKEMIWTSWGLKNKLMGNPDIWLCHQCGDCSSYCPRGVKPADVISSLREINYRYYAKPRFFSVLLGRPVYLPIALIIPTAIILIILTLAGTLSIPEGTVNYSLFFPHAWLNSTFSAITLVAYLFMSFSVGKMWKDMKQYIPENPEKRPFFKSIWEAKSEILSHRKFGGCTVNQSRKISHILVFYGFVLLLLVTIYAIVAVFIHRYPLSFFDPFKILGNIASIMLLTGLGMMIGRRIFKKNKAGNSNYFDWLFLVSMLILTVSGILVELARFLNWQLAYHIYFIHLVAVWFVVIYLPYTKFGHMVYRFAAIVFCKRYNR